VSVRCPAGHQSKATDYCDVCGAVIAPAGAAAAPAAPAAEPPSSVTEAAVRCPHCQDLNLASALFCDSRESLRNEAGEFARAVAEGAVPGEEHIRAELGEVLAGMAPGRRDDGELTLFRSLGVAIEDLAAAERAVATARERGIGTEVEL